MNQETASGQYVTIGLANELFAVEVGRTREILDNVHITKVPQMPSWMLGVINLRGQVVPVIDLRRKLGIDGATKSGGGCVIVLETVCEGDEIILGGLVDRVLEVIELEDHQIEPAPRLGMQLRTDFIQGLGKVGEQFLIILDIERVCSPEELLLVADSAREEELTVGT